MHVNWGFSGHTLYSQVSAVPCIPEFQKLDVEVMQFYSSHSRCVISSGKLHLINRSICVSYVTSDFQNQFKLSFANELYVLWS